MRRLALVFSVLALASCNRAPTPILRPTVVVKPTPTPGPVVLVGWPATQEDRWIRAIVKKEKVHFVESIGSQILRNRARYETVAGKTRVPWMVIASIHNMECGLSFRQNLANGDSLTAKTRHVPKGRPPGTPPFTWEIAAIDALFWDKLDRENWSRIGTTLNAVERYNGIGYQRFHPDVPTPYLWNWTSVGKPGKYVADGKWSPTAISDQCGVVPILRALGL